ncbi:MAG TPA: UDP-N-acetylmuramate--L-alanine ligase [Chloroflexia bacterium]|nr:UDP-N-acetylmuramate--L-alanine ligase [Chloroflexia bacterium]
MSSKPEHWHFIGIGGAGMSVLAHALLDRGATVSGSDQGDSVALDGLRERGVAVRVGHDAADPGLAAANHVVISAAVPETNPELAFARAAGTPVITRAALLGQLMDERTGIAIAGTHGKTTTTAMVTWVLREAGRDPAFLIGGVLTDVGTGGHWGSGAELVAEADEYAGSFWELRPQVAVITNLEADHLDFYGDLDAIRASFRRFAGNLRPGGTLLLCGDDAGARQLYTALCAADNTPGRYALYGTTPDCAWQATGEAPNAGGGTDFVVQHSGAEVATMALALPGRHNVLNALAAVGAAAAIGVAPAEAAVALGRFHGTWRRFQVKGTTGGVLVVDDYAHHPTEIAATLAAARRHLAGRRLVVVFQPHTYTRTQSFLAEFATVLATADVAIICEIYASRETDTLGLSSRQLVDQINALAPDRAAYAADLGAAARLASGLLQSGDVLFTLGAGDVWQVGDTVLSSDF